MVLQERVLEFLRGETVLPRTKTNNKNKRTNKKTIKKTNKTNKTKTKSEKRGGKDGGGQKIKIKARHNEWRDDVRRRWQRGILGIRGRKSMTNKSNT